MMARAASRRLALLGLLMFSATGCGLFAVQSEVGIKEVSVDLNFGFPDIETPIAPTLPDLPPIPTFSLPPAPEPEKPGPPPPPLCGPTTALGPRDPAVPQIRYPDNQPEEGNYLFQFFGNYEDQAPRFAIANKVVSNVTEEGIGFSYSIQDGFNRIRLTFEAQPIDDNNPTADGLFLRKIEIPEEAPDAFGFTQPRLLTFEPVKKLRLLDFPVEPGSEFPDQSPDAAQKSDTGIQDPVTGAPLLSPSGNVIRTNSKVDAPERFIVCEELGQGYKTSLDIEISGEFNIRILGTFWLGTQYGGFPLKEEYVIVGDLIPGNFTSNLMKLDPGDYI